MMVGFSKAGKHTLIESRPDLKTFFRIDSSAIHDRLHETFPELRDDITVHGPAHEERQALTKLVRRRLLDRALAAGIAIVNDSANLERANRAEILGYAKAAGYETKIIWVRVGEGTLLKRLREIDAENVKRGEPAVWMDLYREIQKPRFQPPEASEADELVIS
jgi:predicted kinase